MNVYIYENENVDYRIKFLSANVNPNGQSSKEIIYFPSDFILNDINLEGSFDANSPFGLPTACKFELTIDVLSLINSGMSDVWHLIKNNQRGYTISHDNLKYYNEGLTYFPNVWVFERYDTDTSEFIPIVYFAQSTQGLNEISIEDGKSEYKITLYSLSNWIMNVMHSKILKEYLTFVNNFIFLDGYYFTSGKYRYSMHEFNDGRYKIGYVNQYNLMKQYSVAFNWLFNLMIRQSTDEDFLTPFQWFIDSEFRFSNPLINFNFYTQQKANNEVKYGNLLGYTDVLIPIMLLFNDGYPDEAEIYLQYFNQYKNFWDFASVFYEGYGSTLNGSYDCRFDCVAITDKNAIYTISETDIDTSSIKITDISETYAKIKNRVNARDYRDLSIHTSSAYGSLAQNEIDNLQVWHNQPNIHELSEHIGGNFKRYRTYHDSKNANLFPLDKLMYIKQTDEGIPNTLQDNVLIKVSEYCKFAVNHDLMISALDNFESWGNYENENDAQRITYDRSEYTGSSYLINTIYSNYFRQNFNVIGTKPVYLFECKLVINEFISIENLGKLFNFDIKTIFVNDIYDVSDISNKCVLVKMNADYSNNIADCTFLVRGDTWV